MTQEIVVRTPRAPLALVVMVAFLALLQIGVVIALVSADTGGGAASTAVTPDTVSDQVAATAAEFRVDESGAATYSIPIYTAPGTAGVAPKLALSYSSQGGNGPMGKGWSVSGLSSISRCRATREAGDFIVGGVVTDGSPTPVNYTSTDRYCLDGQRLIPAQAGNAACRAVGGMTVQNLRTEIESFQRVCAFTPTSGSSGPAFFTVERKDGSISWYGDRNNDATANRPDGYFNSTAPGKEAFALSWAQTRFQDSTGNYIDFTYFENPAGAGTGEHLLDSVSYTGKTVLAGQSGPAKAPYAHISFIYSTRATTQWAKGYQSGGTLTQTQKLEAVVASADGVYTRYYRMSYAPSVSGSNAELLSSVQECRDGTMAVCLPATTFTWSDAKHELATAQSWAASYFGSTLKFEGFKLGDVDGDGRQDMVWLKDGSSGETCPTEHIMVSFGELDGSNRQSFSAGVFTGCTPTELITGLGEGSWQLFDYTGDGRDDLFVAGGGAWLLYPSQGRTAQPFNTGSNLLASIYIPRTATKDAGTHPQLTDLNGDGLTDVIYQASGWRVRLMERNGATFNWGAERTVTFVAEAPPPCPPEAIDGCTTSPPMLWNPDLFRLVDFNGDAASDLIFVVSQNWKELCEGDLEECPKPVLHVSSPNRYSYGVSSVTATTVELKRQSQEIFGDIWWAAKPQLGDINADGLTDLLYQSTYPGNPWRYAINTGTSFLPSVEIGTLANSDLVRAIDLNGDGRSDIAFVNAETDGTMRWFVRYALPTGGFSGDERIPGNAAYACSGTACDARQYAHLFSDFDADGALDYFTVRMQSNQGEFYLSQPGATSHGKPRDTIVSITNGLGARTELTYAPLTNFGVYLRDSGSRDSNVWGRGAPVLDFIAPSYVVAKAASSAPQAGLPAAMSTLHYRYAGAKVQAGGRGFLGFREITTIDPNHNNGYVVTTTSYHQNFPFIGMPASTVKAAVIGQSYIAPSCLNGIISNSCYAPPNGWSLPSLGGSWFSDSSQVWESDTEIAGTTVTEYASGVQAPIHVRTAGTDEKLRDPIGGAQTSRVATTFDYGSYGNVTATTVDTFTGTSATAMATVITANTYGDNATLWRLGRLNGSTVTHRRPNRADVVRSTWFAYSMADPVTGQLTVERIQANGAAEQDLRKEYTYDEYGNRTVAETCAAPATSCTTTIAFHPATPTAIQRYSRTTYDSRGRFPVATYEPFWGGDGTVEKITQTVVARNAFGDVTQAYDVNGVDTLAVAGTFGRPYYTWQETVPGSVPGTPTGGVESFTSYRWCGTGGVTCPTGAKFRQKTVAEGAPTTWAYFDVLGRPVMKAAETFNAGIGGKDVAATCATYDASGKPLRASNPFFLSGTAAGIDTAGLSTLCTDTTRKWTTTSYDVLGRPTDVVAPDGSMVSSDYVGLQTTTMDPRGNTTTQTRNAKGELSQVVDHNGLSTTYWYQADGSMYLVSRDAGRGVVENSFVYDVLGRKIRQGDPDAGITDYEYNALGELTAQIDAAGNRIENEIDARGRVWRRTVKQANGTIESQSTFVFDTAANGVGTVANEAITGIYSGWIGTPALALGFSRSYTYDALGRPLGSTTTIDGVPYGNAVQYDTLGRPWKTQDASGRWAKTETNARGMATAVCNSSSADADTGCLADANTYLRTLETDAWGHTIKERRGNSAAMEVVRNYWTDTGRIASICAGPLDIATGKCQLVDEGYGWDAAGNLHTQQKEGRYLEEFSYDNLNRLTNAYVTMQDGVTTNTLTHWAQYDPLGNICAKNINGTGTGLIYTGRAGCGVTTANGSGGTGLVGPHQLSQVFSGTGAAYYYYDARGNQTIRDAAGTSNDRTIAYTLDDKAYAIVLGTTSAPIQRTRFWYGSDGQRYKREDLGKTTLYLGNVEIVTQGGVVTTKRTVAGVMLQTVVGSTATNHYLFHDQLGSLAKITDAAGTPISNQDYTAFGERRDYDTPASTTTSAPTLTTRGFTGHEMVDGLSVIHMNGRIFDPLIGRFLQPDPVIQSPDNAQSWNAYTYVFNNPLRYTDPTGMMSEGVRQGLAAVIAIVAACFGQYYISVEAWGTAFAVMVGGAFVSGAVATKSLQGGLNAAFGAVLTFGVGVSGLQGWEAVAAQAVSGGIAESLQGGNFGHAFAAAGLTAAFMPMAGHSNVVARAIKGALIGGAISEVTGGKFANGAASGAIQAAMMGGDEVHSVEAPETSVKNFSDAPNAAVQAQLNDPNTRQAAARTMVTNMYGEKVASNVQFAAVAWRQEGYYSGPPRPAPNVAADVTKSSWKFWQSPKITIYNRAFDAGSYYGLASIIDHEAFHYFTYVTGGRKKLTKSQHEIGAIDYQITRPAWNQTTSAFKQGMYNYRAACAASQNCGNYGMGE